MRARGEHTAGGLFTQRVPGTCICRLLRVDEILADSRRCTSMPSRTSKQGFHCGGSRSSGVPPTGTSVGARRSRSTSLAEAKMGGGNAQKSAKARADKQAKMAKANKGARARGDDSTILTHAVAPPQFSHLSDPRRTAPATAAPRRLPARVQRQGDEHPVQGLHGHVPVHHDRGEAQGALRQQAPEARFLPVLPSPEAVITCETAAAARDAPATSSEPPRRRVGAAETIAIVRWRVSLRAGVASFDVKDQTSHAGFFTFAFARSPPHANRAARSRPSPFRRRRHWRSSYLPFERLYSSFGSPMLPATLFLTLATITVTSRRLRVSRRGCDGRRCRCRTC